ncbi:CARDB protein, partial [Candidatus Electrothrix marina]
MKRNEVEAKVRWKRMSLISVLAGIILSSCLMVTSSWAIVLRDIEEQSPDVWGIDIDDEKFIPKRGGIKVCKEQNMIIVGFYLSGSNIDFYKQEFSDGKRKPLGFEIDINDVSGVFNRNDITSVVTSFPDYLRYEDNPMGDDEHLYTLAINDPTVFMKKVWHLAAFHFSDHIDISRATFEVQLQLVGDVRKLRDDYHDIYNGYGVDVEMQFWSWFNTLAKYGGGEEDVDGNNFFGIRPSEQIFQAKNFFVGGEEGYDRFLWNWSNNKDEGCGAGKICDYEPYNCSFGSDPWDKSGDNNSGGNGNNQNPPLDEEIIDPGHPRNNGDPDMKISTVNLSKGANSTRHHELEQDPEEKFYAYAKIKNDGTARAKDFKVKFYIDGDKKNFNRDDEDYQGSVRIEEFNSGAEIRYSKELTSPTEPGTYWVYACITSIDEDSDMGNNCSDEDDKEEYGKL